MWTYSPDLSTAAVAAVSIGAAGAATRRSSRPRLASVGAVGREVGLLLGLYVVWILLGRISVMGTIRAVARGRSVWDAERALHLPSERSLQDVLLPHHAVVRGLNLYYAFLHTPTLLVAMAWLFFRHRDAYPRVRNTVVLLTLVCLAIQLVPVAPPRLVPDLHLVDTAQRFGQSVYTRSQAGDADQLSAMPSVHVGWAVLVALAALTASRSRWRLLTLVHPLVMVTAVTATANHYWLDGIVAVALLAPLWLGLGRLSRRRPGPGGSPDARSATATPGASTARCSC